MSLIEVRNLYKVFGKKPRRAIGLLESGMSKEDILRKTKLNVGVNNISFDVKKGEFFVIMGLSGSGKSTTLRCLNRIHEPTAGEILIKGENILEADAETLRDYRRNFFSMVFQHFALFPHRTVRENVEYGLKIQGVDDQSKRDKAYEMLNLVGLKGYEEKMPDELSGGMQQRVGLARALANDPEVLLMDEAFSALDPLIRKEMQDELLHLLSELDKTIIFITHDLNEALKLGDRIAIMKDGEIVQIDTPEGILENPADDYVRDFIQDVNRAKVITAKNIMRKPKVSIKEQDGPMMVLREMNNTQIDSAYVLNKSRVVVGYVDIDDVARLAKGGAATIQSIVKEADTITLDTSIDELLADSISSSRPLGVVDDRGRLVGVVGKTAIIAGITGGASEDV